MSNDRENFWLTWPGQVLLYALIIIGISLITPKLPEWMRPGPDPELAEAERGLIRTCRAYYREGESYLSYLDDYPKHKAWVKNKCREAAQKGLL